MLFGIPLNRGPHSHTVWLLRCQRLAGLVPAFTPHPIVGPGKIADSAIAGAVRKHRSRETKLPAVSGMFGYDRDNSASLLFDLERMHIEKQVNILLGPRNTQLLFVIVVRGRLRISPASRIQFPDNVPQGWIRRKVNPAS
ncbi:hypothetical protein ES703_87667 [subsurface metagenome]